MLGGWFLVLSVVYYSFMDCSCMVVCVSGTAHMFLPNTCTVQTHPRARSCVLKAHAFVHVYIFWLQKVGKYEFFFVCILS